MQGIIGLIAWVCIVLLIIDLGPKGRSIVIGFVLISLLLPRSGIIDNGGLLHALGFVLRILIAIVYLARRKMSNLPITRI